MLGYGNWWTAGFSACQWREVTHRKEYGWAEFYFVHLGAEYDNVCQDWHAEVYVMGAALLLSVADPWGEHPSVLDKTLEEFREAISLYWQTAARTTCPHCGKTVPERFCSKWHGNNCRRKQ